MILISLARNYSIIKKKSLFITMIQTDLSIKGYGYKFKLPHK